MAKQIPLGKGKFATVDRGGRPLSWRVCARMTAYRQPRLFAEPAPRPEQMALMP